MLDTNSQQYDNNYIFPVANARLIEYSVVLHMFTIFKFPLQQLALIVQGYT